MNLPSVDTDGRDDFHIGVELEFPINSWGGDDKLASFGSSTGPDTRSLDESNINFRHGMGGEATHERIGGTEYGYELRTPDGGIHYENIIDWYRSSVEEFEENIGAEMEPTGFYGDTTAGLHVHVSPFDEEPMRELFNLSTTAAMQVFACTSIAEIDNDRDIVNYAPVNRSGGPDGPGFSSYCTFSFNQFHNSVVHWKEGNHWAWRLPEPMEVENFKLLVEFLCWFANDIETAKDFVEEKVRNADDDLTAVKRAKACNISEQCDDQYRNDATDLLESVLTPRIEPEPTVAARPTA